MIAAALIVVFSSKYLSRPMRYYMAFLCCIFAAASMGIQGYCQCLMEQVGHVTGGVAIAGIVLGILTWWLDRRDQRAGNAPVE